MAKTPRTIDDPGTSAFQQGLIRVLQHALGYLADWTSSHTVPTVLRPVLSRDERHGGHTIQQQPSPDVRLIVALVWPDGVRVEELNHLADVVSGEPVLAGRVFATSRGAAPASSAPVDRIKAIFDRYVLPAIERYVGAALRIDFDPDRAAAVCADLEHALRADRIPYHVVAPLENVECDAERLDLDDNTTLRRLTADEIGELWQLAESGVFLTRISLAGIDWCLDITAEAPASDSIDTKESCEHLKSWVTALRLCSKGDVGIACFTHRVEESFGGVVNNWSSSRPTDVQVGIGATYSVSGDRIECVTEAFRAIQSLNDRSRLRVALNRFNRAYGRNSAEDRLIDYWVALEALFLPDGGQELLFRIRLRLALFLSDSPDKRKTIFDLAKESYAARSQVVHGNPVSDLTAIFDETADLLRRALAKAVSAPSSVTPEALTRLALGQTVDEPDRPNRRGRPPRNA